MRDLVRWRRFKNWHRVFLQQLRATLPSCRQWCRGCGTPLAHAGECMTCLRARLGPRFLEMYRG